MHLRGYFRLCSYAFIFIRNSMLPSHVSSFPTLPAQQGTKNTTIPGSLLAEVGNEDPPKKIATILRIVAEQNISFIDISFTDLHGNPLTYTITAEALDGALKHGISFDGSSVDECATTADSDLNLVPDLDSFRLLLPRELGGHKSAMLVADVHTAEGVPSA